MWGGGNEGGERRNFFEVELIGFGGSLGVKRMVISNLFNSFVFFLGCGVGGEFYWIKNILEWLKKGNIIVFSFEEEIAGI